MIAENLLAIIWMFKMNLFFIQIMISEIVCRYPFEQQQDQKQLKLDFSIFNKVVVPQKKEIEEEYYYFSETELWNLLKFINENNSTLDWSQFTSVFQGLGFKCKFSLEHINILARFNTKFFQLKQEFLVHKHLHVKPEDEVLVLWFWRLFQTVSQEVKVEFVFDVLTTLLDLNRKIAHQVQSIQKLSYYYHQLTKQQSDIFVHQNEIEKQSQIEILQKIFANLEGVVKYCRSIFENYQFSTIFGFRSKKKHDSTTIMTKEEEEQNIEIQNDKIVKGRMEKKVHNEIKTPQQHHNRFEMIFSHAIQIQDKKRNQRYQKQLNDLSKISQTPVKKLSISPSVNQISVSPKAIKKISRKGNKSVMDLRGANETIQRLEKARQKKEQEDKFWEKKPKINNKSVKEFNFQVHQLPHPKPYIYVDVNVAIGKKQRIGLYNGDDLQEVANNFGKAHSLSKNQVQGLQMRLEDISLKFR